MEYKLDHGACIPQRVHTVVISTQHAPDVRPMPVTAVPHTLQVTNETIRAELKSKVVEVHAPMQRRRHVT